MDRIDHSSAEQNKFGAGKHGWTNGDPQVEGTGTIPQEEFLDGVQEELCKLVEGFGFTLDPGSHDDIYNALINTFLAKAGGTLTGGLSIARSATTPGVLEGTPVINETVIPLEQYRLIYQSRTTNDNIFRLYLAPFGGLALAADCFYNTGSNQWEAEGPIPYMMQIDGGGINLQRLLSGGNFSQNIRFSDSTVASGRIYLKRLAGGPWVTESSDGISLTDDTATKLSFELAEPMRDDAYTIQTSRGLSIASSIAYGAHPGTVRTTTTFSVFPSGNTGFWEANDYLNVTVTGLRAPA